MPFEQGAVGKGPRYAVYDVEYDLASGEGTRYELLDSGSNVRAAN